MPDQLSGVLQVRLSSTSRNPSLIPDVLQVRLPGCAGAAGGDVQELRFAFELLAEAEPVRKLSRSADADPALTRA